jgi:hypothetical protein
MRGTTYSSKAYFHRERQLNAEAPASPVMQMPLPPRASVNPTTPNPRYKPTPRVIVIVMRKREARHDGVEVWGPEAA